MLGRLKGIVSAISLVAVILHGHAWAVTTGTADGTYDFGSLGASDSAGAGWTRLGDKFIVENNKFIAWPSLGTGPYTAINPDSETTAPYTAVIKASKPFTFVDLGISADLGSQKFGSFDIILKDISGAQIGSTISLGSSDVYSQTSVTNISALYSRAPWSVDGVAAIEITYALLVNSEPERAFFLNMENITIANVSDALAVPNVLSISPLGGSSSGGTAVTITGIDFTGATAVSFGIKPALGFTIDTPGQITALSPGDSAGTVDITVTTPLGTSPVTAADEFRYMAIPTITGISPAIGPLTGGTAVIITGTDFSGATAVKFGVSDAVSYSIDSLTQITATPPAGSPGPVAVSVVTPLGTGTTGEGLRFSYTNVPTVTGISPPFGIVGEPTEVVISGYNFSGATAVMFGGLNAVHTVDSPGQITATAPVVSSAGSVIITVAAPSGTSPANEENKFTRILASGTADGIYDFRNLGVPTSAVDGFVMLGDKFKVESNAFMPWQSFSSDPATPDTSIYPNSSVDNVPYLAVIKAEGGAACATFTFKDLGISATSDLQKFTSLHLTLRDINGGALAVMDLNNSPVYSTSRITNLSDLYSQPAWSVDGVATIEISYTLSKGQGNIPAFASDLNLENITIANVRGAPGISGISPSSGLTTGGTPVIISGRNFTGATSVSFGAIAVTSLTVDSDTRITAMSPGGTAGPVDIKVTTSLGTSAASVADQFTYNKNSQTITFGDPPGLIYGGTTGTVTAAATSGLPVTFSSLTPGVCTVSGSAVTPVSAGPCTVAADQGGNADFTAAAQTTQNITVAKATPVITWTAPAAITFGTPLSGVQLNAGSSGVAGTIVYTPASGTTLGVGAGQILSASFIPADSANYNTPAAVTVPITVVASSQTIGFGAAPGLTYGGAPGSVTATGGASGLPVTFSSLTPGVCAVSGNEVTPVSAGSCTVAANQAGDSNYNAASQATQEIAVATRPLTITANNAARVYGAANPASPGFTVPALIGSDIVISVSYTYALSANSTAAVGSTHGITPGGAVFGSGSASNYSITYLGGTLTISGKADQSIVFNPLPAVTYGDFDFSPAATATSGMGVTYAIENPGGNAVATIINNNIHIVGAGTAFITAIQSGDANHNPASATQTLTVSPETLTVTADNRSRAFGAANPVFTATLTGFVNGDTPAVVSGTPIFTTPADTSSFVGSYPVTPARGTLTAANYTFTFVDGTLAVGLSSQTITFSQIPPTSYGVAPIDLGPLTTGGGSNNPVTFAVVSGPGSMTGGMLTVTGAGDIVITASQAGTDGSYASAVAQQTLTVKPAVLTVTADNQNRAFGAANPTFTYIITGFVNNEDTAVVGGAPIFTNDATAGSPVGSYPIILSPGSLSAANYTFTLVNGTLAVNLASQNVIFDALPAMKYGDSSFSMNASSDSGLPVSYSSSNPAVAAVSDNILTIVGAGSAVITASQAGDVSYASAFAQQTITVAKAAPVIIWATPAAIPYGTPLSGTQLNAGSAGTAGTFVYTPPAGTALNAGAGQILSASFTPADSANYSTPAAVTVPITVTAADQTITFGTAPSLAYGGAPGSVSAIAASGLPVTFSSLTPGVCAVSGTTVTPVSAGSCVIAANQGGNANYTAAAQTMQNISVAKTTPVITWAAPAAMTYGTPLSGVQLNAGSGGVAGTIVYTPATGTTLGAGAGQILSASFIPTDTTNFNAVTLNATIDVVKADQAITIAPAVTKTYGAADFGPGASVSSGLSVSYTSDNELVATITSGGLIHIVGAGTARITASQAGNANYLPATAGQTLTVSKAQLVVTADNVSRVFGGENPDFTVTYNGFVNGEDGNVVSGAPAFTVSADISSPKGSYPVTPEVGTLVAANYSFLFSPGTLGVDLASQTISFAALSEKTYGDSSFNLSATGGASGNPVIFSSSNEAVASVIGTTVIIVGAGESILFANQEGDANFASATSQQVLKVNKAELTVAALNTSRAYGVVNPVFTTSVTGFVNHETIDVILGSATVSTNATPASPVGSYPLIVDAGALKSANYSFTAVNGTLSVGKASQTISFSEFTAKTYGDGTFKLFATGGASENPVVFSSSNEAVAAVNGTTVTIAGAGDAVITASQAGDARYSPAAAQHTLTVNKAALTVTAVNASRVYGAVNPDFSAVFSGFVNNETATVLAGAPVLATSADTASPKGDYPVTVSAGNLFSKNYVFTFVDGTLTVNRSEPVISWTSPSTIGHGNSLGIIQLNATTGTPGMFSYDPPLGTVLNAGTGQTLTVTFIPADTANYSTVTKSVTIDVVKAGQAIIFGTAPSVAVGGSATVAGEATSGLAPIFNTTTPTVCTVSGNTVTGVATGTCTITANQDGNTNYNAALQVVQSFTVVYSAIPPQITLSTLDDGSVSSIATINIAGTLTAPNGLQKLTVNDASVAVSNGDSFSALITLVPGQNTITVVATDNNNLTGTANRTITLDATAPLITLTSGQTDNSVTSSSRTTIFGNVDAATTLVMISINGGAPQPAAMSGTGFSLPVNLSTGLNTIVITATDASGKSSSIKQSVVLNTALSLAVTAPAHDLKIGTAGFILTGMVNGSAPLTVTVKMDGQSFTPTVTNGSFSQAITFASEKTYPIVVTADDGNGSSVNVTRNVSYAWLGDADGSRTADLSDVLNAYHIALSLKQPEVTDLTRCDVAPLDANGKPEGNGIIDIGDVVLMLRNLVGLVNW